MRKFEDYFEIGITKRVDKDVQRASSLVLESERKLKSLNLNLEKVGVQDVNATDYIESCYDILIYLLRAKLYIEGYACSGQGAHEAEVSYMRNLDFNEKDVLFFDEVRYFRNGSKYYGTQLNKSYATKVIEFTKIIYPKLRKILNK